MKWLLFTIVMMALCPGHARAACTVCTCTATATGVSFGIYSPSTQSLSTGKVTMSCVVSVGNSGTVAYSIDLGQGNGSFATRQMSTGGSALNYNLYNSSAYAAIWGDGSPGTSTVSDSYSLAVLTVKNYTVYGAIPAAQNAAAGVYSDTIMVTINY